MFIGNAPSRISRKLLIVICHLSHLVINVLRHLQAQQAGQSKDNEDKKKSSPAEVPRITPHVELPPQVLQVSNKRISCHSQNASLSVFDLQAISDVVLGP